MNNQNEKAVQKEQPIENVNKVEVTEQDIKRMKEIANYPVPAFVIPTTRDSC